MNASLVALDDVTVRYGDHVAVAGVTLALAPGEAVGVVGQSGSGKSTLVRAMLGLVNLAGGRRLVDGAEVPVGAAADVRRRVAARVQPVWQDAGAALDPRLLAGQAVAEALVVHGRPVTDAHVAELLASVGLEPTVAEKFPHELSGGQRQRVVLARALAVEPAALLCDEPVSALDASVAAGVLNLLVDLRRSRGVALLLVSHDLAVVRHACDRVVVMLEGRIVEELGAEHLVRDARHPYTLQLLAAVRGHAPASAG